TLRRKVVGVFWATDETRCRRRLNRALHSILGLRSPKQFDWELFPTKPRTPYVTWLNFSIPGFNVAAVTTANIKDREYWVVGVLQAGDDEEKYSGCLPLLGIFGLFLPLNQLCFVLYENDPRQMDYQLRQDPLRQFKNRGELNRLLAQ
ncbi:MAG TPA: hypothetical protein VFT87_05465, partial [Candidatus Saccharimonadales bacterium]|nr:hypothetical protein [Candidatus Saccharimonadales bacterium]